MYPSKILCLDCGLVLGVSDIRIGFGFCSECYSKRALAREHELNEDGSDWRSSWR